MSDVITKPGFYRQLNGGAAEVLAERGGLWIAILSSGLLVKIRSNGFVVGYLCDAGETIVGPRIEPTPFSVGDLVLVDCQSSEYHQHYGTVETVTDHDPPAFGVRTSHGKLFCGFAATLKPVTLPAPVPEGYRLKPRNVKPVKYVDRGVTRNGRHWWKVDSSEAKTAEERDCDCPEIAPFFFAEPIPQPEQWTPTCELRLNPDGGNGPPRLLGLCHNGYGQNYVLKQRWTCGDKSEWRAVEVTR